MKIEKTPPSVSCATQSPSWVRQEIDSPNNGNVRRRSFLKSLGIAAPPFVPASARLLREAKAHANEFRRRRARKSEIIRKSELHVVAITLVLLASTARLQAQLYGITDLGTLLGTNRSVAYGLNNLGQAVGVSSNPTADIATLFSNGTTKNLNTLGADVSVATSIGGSGQVVGYNFFDSNPNPVPRAFLYSNGTMTDIDSESLFPSGTRANGINSSGVVVGQGLVTTSSFHAFLYSGGQMVDLGGGYQASASAINDSGQIVLMAPRPERSCTPTAKWSLSACPPVLAAQAQTPLIALARSSARFTSTADPHTRPSTAMASGPTWAHSLELRGPRRRESTSRARSSALQSFPLRATSIQARQACRLHLP
jgi:probable HAF family extracellular repeat protein